MADFSPVSNGKGYITATNANFSTARSATTGTSHPSATSDVGYTGAESGYIIYRVFMPFDTSSLPNFATVTAATIVGTFSDVHDASADGNSYWVIVGNTQNDSTSLVDEDYDQVGTTELSDHVAIASGSKTFTLNSTGRAAVSLTTYTKLAIRSGHDLNNSAPAVGQTYGNIGSVTLSVTYSAGGAFLAFI